MILMVTFQITCTIPPSGNWAEITGRREMAPSKYKFATGDVNQKGKNQDLQSLSAQSLGQ